MTCCATGVCCRYPDLCATCAWPAFRVVSCPIPIEAGRCRFIAGHRGICQPIDRAGRVEKVDTRDGDPTLSGERKRKERKGAHA